MDGSPEKETQYPKTWPIGDISLCIWGKNSSGSSREKIYGREEGEVFFFRGPTHRINQPTRKPIKKLTRMEITAVVLNPQSRKLMGTVAVF
jgi:hypothetical protein